MMGLVIQTAGFSFLFSAQPFSALNWNSSIEALVKEQRVISNCLLVSMTFEEFSDKDCMAGAWVSLINSMGGLPSASIGEASESLSSPLLLLPPSGSSESSPPLPSHGFPPSPLLPAPPPGGGGREVGLGASLGAAEGSLGPCSDLP
jgi:hypothetical protein